VTDFIGWIWIAGIAAFFAVCLWLVIRASFLLEQRDARQGRRDLDEGGNVFGPDGSGGP
jgi:uncharacterized membrane protein